MNIKNDKSYLLEVVYNYVIGLDVSSTSIENQ